MNKKHESIRITLLVSIAVTPFACSDEPANTGSTSHPVLSGGSASTSASVRNIANLRALTGSSLPSASNCNDGTGADDACCIIVFGEEDYGDGGGGHYCYKPNETSADNGDSIIKPNSVGSGSAGRWVLALSNETRYAQAFRDRYPSTGGIEGALLSFGSAPACGEIRLPKGTVDISKEIEINGRWGCRIIGHGKNESGSGAGTVLRWTGGVGGRVFNLVAIQNSVFQGFMIDGNYDVGQNGASVGIRYQANDTGVASFDNHFYEIGITDIKEGDGIAIHVGRSDNTQVDHSTFEKMVITHSKVGVRQEGSQTVINAYRDLRFQDMTVYGMDFQNGDAFVERCDFGSFENSGALADVRVLPGDGWATFLSNYHETRDGASYLFPEGTRNLPVNLIGNRVYWLQTDSQRLLDYQQTGPLNLTGNSFSAAVANTCSAGECELYVDPPGSAPTSVMSMNNSYQQGPSLVLGTPAFVAASNDYDLSAQAQLGGLFRLRGASIGLEGGAFLWQLLDRTTVMRQYLDPSGFLYSTKCSGGSCNVIFAALGQNPGALDDPSYTYRIGHVQAEQKLTVGGAQITSGTGAPTASVPNGSLYLRTDGTGPNLYVRENGVWVAK